MFVKKVLSGNLGTAIPELFASFFSGLFSSIGSDFIFSTSKFSESVMSVDLIVDALRADKAIFAVFFEILDNRSKVTSLAIYYMKTNIYDFYKLYKSHEINFILPFTRSSDKFSSTTVLFSLMWLPLVPFLRSTRKFETTDEPFDLRKLERKFLVEEVAMPRFSVILSLAAKVDDAVVDRMVSSSTTLDGADESNLIFLIICIYVFLIK